MEPSTKMTVVKKQAQELQGEVLLYFILASIALMATVYLVWNAITSYTTDRIGFLIFFVCSFLSFGGGACLLGMALIALSSHSKIPLGEE